MASRQRTVDDIVDQAAAAGTVLARRMFGEDGLYCDGRLVSLVCDDRLFIKPTGAGRSYLGSVTEGAPYPGAKPRFLIDGDRWNWGDRLAEPFRITAAALPATVPRKPRKKLGSKA